MLIRYKKEKRWVGKVHGDWKRTLNGFFKLLKPEFRISLFKNSIPTARTHYLSATETNRLMLFKKIIAVYCENHTEHTNTYNAWAECSFVKLRNSRWIWLEGIRKTWKYFDRDKWCADRDSNWAPPLCNKWALLLRTTLSLMHVEQLESALTLQIQHSTFAVPTLLR
jgi:hypothetical protein